MDKNFNVLIADDEKEIISVLRLFLEKENINVYEAYDGEMAYPNDYIRACLPWGLRVYVILLNWLLKD